MVSLLTERFDLMKLQPFTAVRLPFKDSAECFIHSSFPREKQHGLTVRAEILGSGASLPVSRPGSGADWARDAGRLLRASVRKITVRTELQQSAV